MRRWIHRRTVSIANEYSHEYPQVKVAYWPERLGKGGGILHGLRFASGDVIVIIDVDLSAPPYQISRLANLINSGVADLIVGSRNLQKSIITDKPPTHRKYLGRTFNFLFRLLFHKDFHDTQCGFKAIKSSVLRDLSDDLSIEGYAFDIDIILKALKKGYRVIEIPIVWGYRRGSKVNSLSLIFEMARSLLIIWLENQKRGPPESIDESGQKVFYDAIAGDTYYRAAKSWFLPRSLWHRVKNKLIAENVKKDAMVLDVGCGSGTIVERLLPIGNIYGIDIGKGFIKFCHDNYGDSKNSGFVLADARCIPFRTEAFDHVVCSEVLEHVHNPEVALNEFYRVLRNSGRLILTTPNISVRWGLIEAVWTRVRREMIEIGIKLSVSEKYTIFSQ